MEWSLSSLVFKGSIVEAISEAKQQKKLFVVYLAGDNLESKNLETSTWTDPNVAEALTKYCIMLHILEGSSEASQFSAIYPQNSTPSITAIGYNGARLWQTEGFVAAEVLSSSLEKAWLSLHVQETTAALFTAALASEKQLTAQSSETISSEQVTPGGELVTPGGDESSSSSIVDCIPSPDVGQLNSETNEERNDNKDNKEADPKENRVDFLEAPHANVLDTGGLNESTSKTEAKNTSLDPQQIGQNNHEELAFPDPGENSDKCDHRLNRINGTLQKVANEASEVAQTNSYETTEVEKAHNSDSYTINSNDVFLNIRLPDGSSLQFKFSVMDTLRVVKDYIDNNLTSSLGSFDLAIPYPRRVFNDQELDGTLSALGLFNRQALIVVPHAQTNSRFGGGSSSRDHTYSSNDDGSSNRNAGYWASIRRILSYVNPFSYLSGGAGAPSAAQESQTQSGIWQYSPNPSLQNNMRSASRLSNLTDSSPDQSKPANASGSKQTSGFGSNIHTLKHDEEDDRFNDRNAFWNGNSTQYGGNDDGK